MELCVLAIGPVRILGNSPLVTVTRAVLVLEGLVVLGVLEGPECVLAINDEVALFFLVVLPYIDVPKKCSGRQVSG